jgi:ABC-type proline/glycine betaine transport system permease subunit
MELNKIKQRLELALRPAEPPTLEEVLEQVSTRGVLRGPVDWVFPAWMLYVEYAVQKIAETFPLSEEEKRQLLHFQETLKQVLLKTWMQTKEKVTILRKADGMYKIEGDRVYAPDGTWIYIGGNVPHLRIHGVTAEAYFPDVLKLPRERLELLQLGWRASDEGNKGGRPYMGTTQPWQVFAWTATRYGALRIDTNSVVLTREGASVTVRITARSWRQRWSKAEAVDLVAGHLRREEWGPVLTMWLGDGDVARKEVLHSNYKIVIATKEPWKLSNSISAGKAFVARGKEAFARLREAAGVYGELLDQLRAYKWIYIKLATDDGFRAAYKLKTRKRSIDMLKETYRHNNGEISTEQFSEADKPGAVAVAGVVMYLELVSGRAGSLTAKYYTRDLGKALAIAGRLESAGLRPNVVRSGPKYVVYIATADLLKLAERDGEIRKAIALYLAEKVKNGTPRQREIAEKILKRNPFFSHLLTVSLPSSALPCVESLLPILIHLFGIEASKIALISLIAFYPIALSVMEWSQRYPRDLATLIYAMGGRRRDVMRYVVLPSALPGIVTGLKIALSTAHSVSFIAESLALTDGLGALIYDSWHRLDFLEMYAAIITLGVAGAATYAAMTTLEKKLIK